MINNQLVTNRNQTDVFIRLIFLLPEFVVCLVSFLVGRNLNLTLKHFQ